LKKNYELHSEVIMSEDLFPDINTSFEIAKFKKRHHLQISFNRLKRAFASHGLQLSSEYPSSSFVKASIYDKSEILMAFYDAFYDTYPTITIHNLNIAPLSYFDQGEATLQAITIPKSILLKKEGTLRIKYLLPSHRVKQLALRYTLDAELEVVQTSQSLPNNTIINENNTYIKQIPFVTLRDFPLNLSELENVRSKHYLKKNTILTTSMIKPIALISKHEKVRIKVKQHGVKIEFYATAQEEGSIGNLIKVKTPDNRILSVRVISKGVCELE
jgi:flagellar basal body P-ring formation protein FlgA